MNTDGPVRSRHGIFVHVPSAKYTGRKAAKNLSGCKSIRISCAVYTTGIKVGGSTYSPNPVMVLTCFKLEEQSRMAAMVFIGNAQRHCPVSSFLGAPVRESAARPSARCAWRPALCAVQVAAPATEGSTGTYSGKDIKAPLVGSHFLHIDDFSKEVRKGCLFRHVFNLAVVTCKHSWGNALYKIQHARSPLLLCIWM